MPHTPLDPLSTLAIRAGTDKFGLHDYTPNYHRLFAPFRERPVRLLEIGVGGYADEDRGGQSLATWRDYFEHGEITGIDIQRKALDLGPRVRILQGSQVDETFLARVVAERGPFDLIVDDGSHRNEHVVGSLRLLFPSLAPGGIYAVEDVQTAFMPRFGGSLDLAAPNSVGRFTELLGEVGSQVGGQVGGEVARVVRFHNVIAMERAGGLLHALDPDEPVAALPASASEEEVRAAFAALPVPGQLRIEGRPEDAMLALLRRLFVQVDHREVAQAHPGAQIDPMAPLLQRVEVHRAGATLRKAPNDYPSNFAFDAEHPEARAALAAMAEVLEGWEGEEGLVHYARLLTTLRGREAAAPWIARLEGLGARSRVFFHLAGGLAQREKRFADGERLFRAGVERFPDDAILAQGVVGALLAQDRAGEAREALARALGHMPRSAALHLLMARVEARLGEPGLEPASRALAMSPPHRRAPALIALGEAQARAGRHAEAKAALTEAAALPGRYAARAWRSLSGIHAALGEAGAAAAAAERAARLRPEARTQPACDPGERRASLGP